MCSYDDMIPVVDPAVVARLCYDKNIASTSTSSSITSKRTFLWKTIGWAKVCLLVLLVLNPASAVPITRWRRTAKHSTVEHTEEQSEHIQREHRTNGASLHHRRTQQYPLNHLASIEKTRKTEDLGHKNLGQYIQEHIRQDYTSSEEEIREYSPRNHHRIERYTPEQKQYSLIAQRLLRLAQQGSEEQGRGVQQKRVQGELEFEQGRGQRELEFEQGRGFEQERGQREIEFEQERGQEELEFEQGRGFEQERRYRGEQEQEQEEETEYPVHRQERNSLRMADEGDNASAASRGRRATAPHWSEPCTGLMIDENNTPKSLSGHILHSISLAYSYINKENFKNKFANETQNYGTWEEMVEQVKKQRVVFDFLEMADAPDKSFNTTLQHSYEKMQRVAVGIEQVTLDQALYQGSLLTEFRTIENYIVKILCNLHHAMKHESVNPRTEVTKEIMSENYRDLDGKSRARALRDAVIVIKFNDAIEELSQIFNELKESLPQ